MKAKQIVVCSAIRQNGVTVCGARHFDRGMVHTIRSLDGSCMMKLGTAWEQGFIDQFGKFLTREEAFQVVKNNGQPFDSKRNGGSKIKLYSEGLY